MKKKTISTLILSSLLIGVLANPIQCFADGGRDIEWDEEGVSFKFDGGKIAKYYKNRKMYLQEHQGFTFFSPVNQYNKNFGFEDVYENDKFESGAMSKPGRDLLIKKNGKVKSINFRRAMGVINDGSYKTIKKDEGYYNAIGSWSKGYTGEWRYLGYNSFGDSINNPIFPGDYPTNYRNGKWGKERNRYPWDYKRDSYIKEGWKKYGLIHGTVYDDKDEKPLFNKKKKAIREILKRYPEMRDKSVEWWADRLSLQSNPDQTSPIFAFVHIKDGTVLYRTISIDNYRPKANLSVQQMNVYDKDDNLIATFERSKDGTPYNTNGKVFNNRKLVRGNKYKVRYKVKNTKENTKTSIDPSILDYSNAYKNGAWDNSPKMDSHFSGRNGHGRLESSGIIRGGDTKEFSTEIEVPLEARGSFRFGSVIPDKYYQKGENLDSYDDWGRIIMDVSQGNLIAKKAVLYDTESGKEVENAVPGKKYKIRYYIQYVGDEVDEDTNVIIQAQIKRKLPGDRDDLCRRDFSKKVHLTPNKEFFVESSTFVAEIPNIETVAYIDSSLKDMGVNDIEKDDNFSNKWDDYYDLSISNVKVLAPIETIHRKGTYNFTVKYDIDNIAPKYLDNYDRDVKVSYAVNGKKYEDTIHIKKGMNYNITKNVQVYIDPAKENRVKAVVDINSDGYVYEKKFDNNIGKGENKLIEPIDPHRGACALSGRNTHNEWTQRYNIHYWNGEVRHYDTFNGYEQRKFNYFTDSNDNYKTRTESEDLNIQSIEFKSKYTEDKNLGKNGWVDITNGDNGKIKAGYGFELKVKVNYHTSAFLGYETELKPWINGPNGKAVMPLNGIPNLPDELYLQTPDNKIISVNGNNHTNSGLVVSRSGDKSNVTWTYSIKPKDTLNVKNNQKIYIDENTKDGIYKFKVFTPEIVGIPTKNSSNWLCDYKDFNVEVIGSDTEDINTHIVE